MYQVDFANPCHLYFIGIGGVSMSGLALVFKNKGFSVSGSDRSRSDACTHLEENGVQVFYGHRASNITTDIQCVIYTSAIKKDNPEYMEAVKLGIPLLTRGEIMGQLMKHYACPIGISGTHGKTTTTSMLSEILLEANLDPTLFIGGSLKSIQGNVRIGRSDYLVTEACEYTNSFLSFFPKCGVILNVEEDHLDFFQDLDDIRHSFREFAHLLPEDGCLVINGEIEQLDYFTKDLPCKVLTFGLEGSCDYVPTNLHFENNKTSFTLQREGQPIRAFTLQVPGKHNICNALAAIALADFLEIPDEVTAKALKEFTGADRRFERKGSLCGVEVIDDYAHHPSEICATLTAAKAIAKGRIWCVFQPHTYTRTKAFLEDFAQALSLADQVVLADIYAARETDTLGISSATLQDAILALNHPCEYFKSFDEIENFLLENCIKDDMLITMGAGDVYKIGNHLLGIS